MLESLPTIAVSKFGTQRSLGTSLANDYSRHESKFGKQTK